MKFLTKILKFIFSPTDVQKSYRNFVGILILAVFAFLFSYPKGPDWIRKEVKLHLGLDLAGGAHLVYQADVANIPYGDKELAVEGTRDIIERRVNAFGVGEPVVQTNVNGDSYRIIVELPGVTDITEAIKRIGETPVLEFKEQAEQPAPVPLSPEEKAKREVFNEAAKDRAEEILKKAVNLDSAGFAKLADEFSEDPGNNAPDGKQSGGDLGFQKKGSLVPAFEAILFDTLKDGETYPELVRTQFGYHIIRRVAERTASKVDASALDIETEGEGKLKVEDVTNKEGDLEGEKEVQGRHILITTQSLEPETPPYNPWENTELSGKQLKRASVQFDQTLNAPHISLQFNSEGADLFEQLTERNVDKPIAIFLDGEVLSAPRVQQKITGGQAVITGTFTLKEAELLAKRLNSGALPVPVSLVSQQKVGASLGRISIEKSFLAGLVGFLFVALFMILYYRLPGVLAVIALVIYGMIMLAVFKLIPVVMTLSGIAGFLFSIGIALDANVLIFERMKEEVRNGKPLGSAIDEGFSHAWNSIRDSNVSSLITAFVLIWLGTGLIKGFAITLSIGILVSMFSAISITRVFLKAIVPYTKKIAWLWGMK
ncbi:MAG: hypothetical protein UW24_C0002G0045 [Parcubacteria group bacterium GW2011_GWA2_44_12]|nr:MAG: hypothetical protein UW24_C0002G0045 [Parcubacteria group bacterium GW2011_GWA2_44_12]